jgi:DNA-binding MarR family transcriptional regulator
MPKRTDDLLTRLSSSMDLLADHGRAADAAAVSALKLDLGANELAALRWLDSTGLATMRAMAEAIDLPRSSATTLVDRLVEKDLVLRVRDEGDRRVVRVSLTPLGKAVIGRSETERSRLCAELLATFNPAEQQALVALLERLAAPASAEARLPDSKAMTAAAPRSASRPKGRR